MIILYINEVHNEAIDEYIDNVLSGEGLICPFIDEEKEYGCHCSNIETENFRKTKLVKKDHLILNML